VEADILRLDRTACAGAISVFIVFTFLFASFSTVSAEKPQTDYVRYVVVNTVIEGDIVDNDLGTPVGEANGASVSGEVHSDTIFVNAQADANGHFRIVLPGGENHTYVLKISAIGYDNRTLTGSVESGKREYLRIPINYNPFGLSPSENSGSLTREWNDNIQSTYEYRMSTDFPGYKSNVKQLGGYNDYFATASRTTSGSGYKFTYYDPYRGQNVTFYSNYFDARDYSAQVQITDRWYYANGSTFIDYDSSGSQVWANQFNQNYTASNGSEIALDSALKNVTYRPNVIRTNAHSETRAYGYLTTGGVRIRRYATPYWLHFHTRSDLGSGVVVSKQNFTISLSEYASLNSIDYYRNNGSFIRTDTIDYSPAPWDNVQATLTATPRNGYTGGVRLSLEFDNEITATLEQSELHFSSSASTTLTLKPKDNTHGSSHPVLIRAYDSNNRLVFGTSGKPALTYDLSLTTPPKPAQLVVQYLLSSGTSYISVGVNSLYTGALQGASVELRYSNGALLTSGTTGSNGTATFAPSPWPLNTNLTVTASYPGYFGGSSSVNTGSGGTKGASISLSKGDFSMLSNKQGYATVRPDGSEASYDPGKVKAYVPWGQPGWLGGSVGLTGQITVPDYFSSYQFQRNYMNPSGGETSGYDEVWARAITKKPCSTSCGVRVYGTAGSPTNYQRNADVSYTVKLAGPE